MHTQDKALHDGSTVHTVGGLGMPPFKSSCHGCIFQPEYDSDEQLLLVDAYDNLMVPAVESQRKRSALQSLDYFP